MISKALAVLLLVADAIAATPQSTEPQAGPAAQPNPDGQKLRQEGIAFATGRDFGKAVERFSRATEFAQGDSNLWVRLGLAYKSLKRFEEAEKAYRKAIQVNPREPNAYNNLGVIYRAQGRLAEAEANFRQQYAIDNKHPLAHGNLGSLLIQMGRYAEAKKELEEAGRISPGNSTFAVELGIALQEAGDTGQALSQFDKTVKAFQGAGPLNEIAYHLAKKNLSLDLAMDLARRAISLLEADLATGKLGSREVEQEDATESLSACWDTLGWIYFRKGDLAMAERYLLAARALRPSAEMDLHIGRLYQQMGKREDAIRRYAVALTEESPGEEPVTLLKALLGPGGDPEAEIQKGRMEGAPSPCARMNAPGQVVGSGEFYFVLAPGGRVLETRLLQGPAALKSLEGLLAKIIFPDPFPSASRGRLVLRGLVDSNPDTEEISVRLLPCDAFHSRPGGKSDPSAARTAERQAQWAGPEGVKLGFTRGRIQAFQEALGSEGGLQAASGVREWLGVLSGASAPSLSAWALARRLEAGDFSAFQQYRQRMLDHLLGLSKTDSGSAESVIKDPAGLPSALTIAPAAPFWKFLFAHVRGHLDQPLDTGIYAIWCYNTQGDQKDLILELAAKTTAPVTLTNPHSDPWNDPRFWIIVDWAMAWGTEQDFAAIEAALQPGATQFEFQRIRQRTLPLHGFWAPRVGPPPPGSKESAKSPAAKVTTPAEIPFSQMKVKHQPLPPAYPKEARARRMMTTVQVQMTIASDGAPALARLVPGPWLAFFGPTALEFSRDWRFEPATINGVPQSATFLLTMPFRMTRF